MTRKILIVSTVALCFTAAIIGYVKKGSYTNLSAKENVMDYFSVALLNEELAMGAVEIMREELPKSKIILRVKAEGKMEFMFKQTKQYAKVMEVYKGEDVQTGDEISVIGPWRFYFDEDMAAQMGFVNYMKKNDEYLVFLKEKVTSLYLSDNNTYRFEDYIVVPIFNYGDKENKVISIDEDKDNSYVSYSDVSQNEFFVSTQNALEKMLNLKNELVRQYQYE